MRKRILTITLIFIFTSLAWILLGSITAARTKIQEDKLKTEVGQLWGTEHRQSAPDIYYESGGENAQHITPEGNEIVVDLDLDYRKKGGLWYSVYRVDFNGKYLVENNDGNGREIVFQYSLPTRDGIYDNLTLKINGESESDVLPVDGKITKTIYFEPQETKDIEIAYGSQGMDQWWYIFGSDISQVKDFKLEMTTDFSEIDFPENSISPTYKEERDGGWLLVWEYSNLISSVQIGMEMPKRANPGPVVSKASFFSPISLLIFLVLLFFFATMKGVDIHPVNYLFISAGFFSFNLLLAYLVDHMSTDIAFLICSVVSVVLVVSYMRLVVGMKIAFLWVGLLQLVYFILFLYAFLLPGYTGLVITVFCIITLFLMMQFTGRIKWDQQKSIFAPQQQPSLENQGGVKT